MSATHPRQQPIVTPQQPVRKNNQPLRKRKIRTGTTHLANTRYDIYQSRDCEGAIGNSVTTAFNQDRDCKRNSDSADSVTHPDRSAEKPKARCNSNTNNPTRI